MGAREFSFRFDPAFKPFLLALGIAPQTTGVTVDDTGLRARFGPWCVETSIANVAGGQISGPYRWYRAIGARFSFADGGLTFGTSTRQGACISFHEPVAGLDPFGALRHPGLTLTVDEPRELLGELQRRGAVFVAA